LDDGSFIVGRNGRWRYDSVAKRVRLLATTWIEYGMPMMDELLDTIPQIGRLEWIGVAPLPRGSIVSRDAAKIEVNKGLVGDHHASSGKGNSKRQVTLIQAEHLPAIEALSDADSVAPEQLRRNLLVSGVNLLALKKRTFRVGEVLLEGTGPCEPCSRMEATLGPGGFNAMRGHGGICARVLRGGTINVGDEVAFVNEPAH
jgi:MOSC domain-containing protein YiiM